MSDEDQRAKLIKFVDWLYADDDATPIEEVEAELRESGVDIAQVMVRVRELLSRYRRNPQDTQAP